MPKRTAKTIEESKVAQSSDRSTTKRRTQTNPNSLRNLKPFAPGVSGNPGGRPKNDLAQEIARAIFENDAEAIYRAFAKTLRGGNAYSFDVLANRAFGKMKEIVVHEGLDVLAEKINKLRKQKNGDSRPAESSAT